MSYSTPDPDNFVSDGDDIIEGYKPFIADVTLSTPCEPFKHEKYDFRSKEFDPPLPLSDYCLIAKQKWEEDNIDEQSMTIRLCSLQ